MLLSLFGFQSAELINGAIPGELETWAEAMPYVILCE